MTEQFLINFSRDVMYVTLLTSAPVLLTGLAVGLLISVFQAVTQIQEMTLTFVPKILAVMIAFIIGLPFMMHVVLGFSVRLFSDFLKYTY